MTKPLPEDRHITRVPPIKPLSPTQYTVAMLVGINLSYPEIAAALTLTPRMVRQHVLAASRRIPGDMPAKQRVQVWARGGSLDVLMGDALYNVMRRDRQQTFEAHPILAREA